MPAEPHDRATIIRKPLLTALLGPRGRLCGRVEVKEITFEPGQKTGLHLHKIPVVGYIAAGEFLFQVEGKPAKRLKAGDAFYEPADTQSCISTMRRIRRPEPSSHSISWARRIAS